jgi:protein N-terminal methyltransferase
MDSMCLENLEDDDLIRFLTNCRNNLEEDGRIVIKENIINKGVQFWAEDFSKARSDILFKEIFLKSGFKIIKHIHYPSWPKDLLDVSIFLLAAI